MAGVMDRERTCAPTGCKSVCGLCGPCAQKRVANDPRTCTRVQLLWSRLFNWLPEQRSTFLDDYRWGVIVDICWARYPNIYATGFDPPTLFCKRPQKQIQCTCMHMHMRIGSFSHTTCTNITHSLFAQQRSCRQAMFNARQCTSAHQPTTAQSSPMSSLIENAMSSGNMNA